MIRIAPYGIEGDLMVPEHANAVVLFSHGSGSSRMSRRNRFVAAELNRAGFATLLLDLLTPEEDRFVENRFDIPMLADRLVAATEWLRQNAATSKLPVGYFGASTGAASALVAATRTKGIYAIVSRGGRPDLAGDTLSAVTCPVLLIVGGEDHDVLRLNRSAQHRMDGNVELVMVPGATHLFEEAGALEEVTRLAKDWFQRHLCAI